MCVWYYHTGFKWSGAGATLFGGSSSGPRQQGEEDNPEAFEASGDFKPVLEKLPDLIEVKTGESLHARLYVGSDHVGVTRSKMGLLLIVYDS